MKNPTKPQRGQSPQQSQQETAAFVGRGRCGGSRADGAENVAEPGASGAAPGNTAPDNCNPSGSFKALRWGVDSLYLSYQGQLDFEVQQRLKSLKALAQGELDQALTAQLPILDHVFEVSDKGAGSFPYVLRDNAFRIQLARSGTKLPMAYVQVSAEYLAFVGPEEAEARLRSVLEQLGALEGLAAVSRIDLFADFVTTDSLDVDRKTWVSRSQDKISYAAEDVLTGWSFGIGGSVSARIYDKCLQIQKKGIGWVVPLWLKVGWHPSQPVWRLEFQLERDFLRQKSLVSLVDVLRHRNGLWSYLTTEWLRLTIPNPSDNTRSRWAVHPLWASLSSIDWEGYGGPLKRFFAYSRPPSERWIGQQGAAVLTSLMATHGEVEFMHGIKLLADSVENYLTSRGHELGVRFEQHLEELVRGKARRYNSMVNVSNESELEAEAKLAREARDYRKESGR